MKIIIQQENNGEGYEIWREIDDDIIKNATAIGKIIVDMVDIKKVEKDDIPF